MPTTVELVGTGAVIVTGAASGIGRACARALVADGRRVVLWDIADDARPRRAGSD
ncbi:SDR family NAD(P)-dependent oxidoreductase [Mycolicibacterium palauense]|uniref:SDR family NAD(P)-dependent oxidoreductase n=1 Tax=Mycolicibacterium palauense TaxID=2034511 RepID=UPI001FE681E3|nr:SDR family NAD(P)-dependent oxidoreductase [Mycolicibacterium palauense]